MFQNEEEQKNALTCHNNACAKIFHKPLKALNLQVASAGPYDACPYCLTEINRDEVTTVSNAPISVEVDEKMSLENQVHVPQQSIGCSYHLGYLSERDSKDQIPDECIICKEIVECMLRKMKD